jgi:hypothetical protein
MHFGEGYFNLFQFYENVFASGKSTIKVQPEILAIFFLGELYMVRLGSVSFYSPFLKEVLLWVGSRLVCSFCEEMAGSLSMASNAVSSVNVAVVDSGEVSRSAVHNRYNNDPSALPWGTAH